MAQRKFCVNCHYPLLPLARFEGISSLDAPRPTAAGEFNNGTRWVFLAQLAIPWWFLRYLWRTKQCKKRQREVVALKRRVLPVDPEAQVCPLCLHIEWSFVRL